MSEMNTLPPEYRPSARPDLLFKELSDGGIIYEPQSETMHTLNATAAFIWVLCDGQHCLNEIISEIRNNFTSFETDPETEVLKAIRRFQALNLLIDK